MSARSRSIVLAVARPRFVESFFSAAASTVRHARRTVSNSGAVRSALNGSGLSPFTSIGSGSELLHPSSHVDLTPEFLRLTRGLMRERNDI